MKYIYVLHCILSKVIVVATNQDVLLFTRLTFWGVLLTETCYYSKDKFFFLVKSNGCIRRCIKGCLITCLVNRNILTNFTNTFISSSFFAKLLLTYLLFISKQKYTYLKISDQNSWWSYILVGKIDDLDEIWST